MKLKVPLTDRKEVQGLCQAGADELFCGIEPFAWKRHYRDFAINQRVGGANFSRMQDLEKAVDTAHRYGVKVHLAVNAFFYLEEQYKKAIELIKDVLDIGVLRVFLMKLGFYMRGMGLLILILLMTHLLLIAPG